MRASGRLAGEVEDAGYRVAFALAEDMLRLGQVVIADSVNPVRASREAWRAVAARTGQPLVEVEIVRSDAADHRRHVEARVSDIEGLVVPSWAQVQARDYEPWPEPHVIVDTTGRTPDQSVTEILGALQRY